MKSGALFLNEKSICNLLDNVELENLLNNLDNDKNYDDIIINNIELVISIVKNRFKTVDYDKKELVSVGVVGLINAVNNYEKDKGDFKNYLTVCISDEILMFLRKINKYNNIYGGRYESCCNNFYSDDVYDEYMYKEKCNYIYNLIDELSDKKKQIIIMYFGFYGSKVYTQKDIAEVLGVSQSYVSKAINEIIIKFKYKIRCSKLFEKNKIYLK